MNGKCAFTHGGESTHREQKGLGMPPKAIHRRNVIKILMGTANYAAVVDIGKVGTMRVKLHSAAMLKIGTPENTYDKEFVL